MRNYEAKKFSTYLFIINFDDKILWQYYQKNY